MDPGTVSANSASASMSAGGGDASDAAAPLVPLDEALAAAAASPHVDSQAAATAGTPAMHDNHDSGTPPIIMPLAANFDSSDIAATDNTGMAAPLLNALAAPPVQQTHVWSEPARAVAHATRGHRRTHQQHMLGQHESWLSRAVANATMSVSASPVAPACLVRLHVEYSTTVWGEHVVAIGAGANGQFVVEPAHVAHAAAAKDDSSLRQQNMTDRGVPLECHDDGHGRRTWVGAAAVAAPSPSKNDDGDGDGETALRYRYIVVDDGGHWLREEAPLGGFWRVLTSLPTQANLSHALSIEVFDTWREGRGHENIFAHASKFRRVIVPHSASPPPPTPPRRDGAQFDADFANGVPAVTVNFSVRAPIPLAFDDDVPATIALCVTSPFDAVITMAAAGKDQTGVYRATCVLARGHMPLTYHYSVVRQVPGVPGVPGRELERERGDRAVSRHMLRGAAARNHDLHTSAGGLADDASAAAGLVSSGLGGSDQASSMTARSLANGAHVVCVDDGAFRRQVPPWRGAGVAVPVFSLRASNTVGVGDFGALAKFAPFVAACGARVLQILPVNDTRVHGDFRDSYPYGVLSSVALHPLYLDVESMWTDAAQQPESLQNVPVDEQVTKMIASARSALDQLPDVDYPASLAAKLDIARTIFRHLFHSHTKTSAAYIAFVAENAEWLRPYAAYNYLAYELYQTTDTSKWGTLARATESDVDDLCSPEAPHYECIEFVFFTQYILHVQLKRASEECERNRIALKGDLSIGVHPRSVDVWSQSHYFRTACRTGAPPDYFDSNGQNWGFPTYDWDAMEKDGFQWWRRRMRRLAEYFHAYRIDHVLGFFRIWELPYWASSGKSGQLRPSLPYTRQELESAGLWDIEKYTEPFLTERSIFETLFGEDAGYGGRLPPPPASVLPPAVVVGGGVGGGVQYVASPVSKSKEEMKMLTPQQKLQAWRKEQEQLLAKRMEVVQLLVYNYFVPHPKDASRLAFRKEVCTETLSDAFFSVPRSMEEALAKEDEEIKKQLRDSISPAASAAGRAAAAAAAAGDLRLAASLMRGTASTTSPPEPASAPAPDGGDSVPGLTKMRRIAEECRRLRLLFRQLHSHVIFVRDSDEPDRLFHPRFDISGDAAREAAREAAARVTDAPPSTTPNFGDSMLLTVLPERPAPCGNPAFTYGVSSSQHRDVLRGWCHDYFYGERNADVWRRTAMARLPSVVSAGIGMLCCAEDLGLVPDVVPGVMGNLGLLGLRIERMPCAHEEDFVDDDVEEDDRNHIFREMGLNIDAREFGSLSRYPYLSVCSPSCHDASPFRLWLEEDFARRNRYEEHLNLLVRVGRTTAPPPRMHAQDPSDALADSSEALAVSGLARDVIWNHLCAPSALAVFPLQDVLAMRVEPYGSRPPATELINDPSNPEHYWRYRVLQSVESLCSDVRLTDEMDRLVRESGRDAAGGSMGRDEE